MKTLLLIACFFSSTLFLFASDTTKTKNDLQELGLISKVKTVRQTSYQAVVKNKTVQTGISKNENKNDKDFYVILNIKGYKTEKNEYNADGSFFKKVTYQYDDKYYLVEEDRYNAKDSVVEVTTFSYVFDDKGNKIEKNWSNGRKVIYKYHTNGYLSQIVFLDKNGIQEHIETYAVEEKGNATEDVFNKPDGSLNYKVTYKYDDRGNKAEEIWYNAKEQFTVKYLKKYDGYGNILEVSWLNVKGKPYANMKRKYEYDKNGNWVKYVQYKNGKAEYVLMRELEYF